MKSIVTVVLCIYLGGCGYFSPKIKQVVTKSDGEVVETFHTQNSFIQETISNAESKCDVKISDLSETAQAQYMILIAVNKAPNLCGNNGGRNYFDMKTEGIVAVTNTVDKVFKHVADFGKIDAVAGAATKIVDSVGRNSANTTFNTDLSGVQQSAGTSSATGEGGDIGSQMDVTTGTTGSGDIALSENGVRSNVINIGGPSSVAGDRAAAGDQALINGDDSLQSFIEDSELKQSPLADDQNELDNSNGEGFDDNDGGNGVSLDF